MSNTEEFYRRAHVFVDENKGDLETESVTVALFRVALEKGAETMGMPLVCYLISRLLSVTLGIIAGDTQVKYEDILDEFDDETKH